MAMDHSCYLWGLFVDTDGCGSQLLPLGFIDTHVCGPQLLPLGFVC